MLQKLMKWIGYKTEAQRIHTFASGVATLELKPQEVYKISPTSYNHGAITITGGLRCAIVYTVFDDKIMEFVEITVQVSSLNSYVSVSHVISSEPETKGERIECDMKPEYLKPWKVILKTLGEYFAPYRDREARHYGF